MGDMLSDLIYGIRARVGGVLYRKYKTINFIGATAEENDTTGELDLTFDGSGTGTPAVRTVATYDLFEALTVSGAGLVDGVLYTVQEDPTRGPWVWDSGSGANVLGDRKTVVQLDETGNASNGRFYNTQGAAVLPTFAAARSATAGKHETVTILGRAVAGDGGGGIFDDVTATEPAASDDDGTLLVAGSRRLRRRRPSDALHPQWFGTKGDNSTNDAAALASAFSALGSTSTRMRSGTVRLPNKTSVLNSTLAVTRFSGVLAGDGTGTALSGQSALRWGGSTSDPLIRLQRCWGTRVQDMRLIGKAASPPSAAIDLHSVKADGSPYNTNISIENVWIGGISSEDSVISNGFENGITFSGVGDPYPVQNDQSSIRKCMFQDISTCGVDIQMSQSTIVNIEECKFNAVPIGVQTVSRGLVVKHCFFSTVDKCVNLAGDSGVHIENCGAEGCAQLLVAEGGTGGGVTIRGEYFQVNAGTVAAGAAMIDINGGGSAVHLVIEDLTINSDGAPDPGEIKIKVTNCSHLTLVCRNLNWYDGLSLEDHVDIATESNGQSRLVIWEYQGKEYVNYWEHGAHANAQMGQRVDHPNGATISSGAAVEAIAVDGTTRTLLKWNPTGPFANYAELGDGVTPVAIGNDFRAKVAGIDIRDFRNLLGLLGYIQWNASSMGGVKIIPNEGSPEGVATAEPGSLCLDYDTPKLYFKASGSGNTGWTELGATGPAGADGADATPTQNVYNLGANKTLGYAAASPDLEISGAFNTYVFNPDDEGRVVTVKNAGASNGFRLRLVNSSGASGFDYEVKNNGGTHICTVLCNPGFGPGYVELEYTTDTTFGGGGINWVVVDPGNCLS